MPAPPSPKTALARLLATCAVPVYALDDRRRIAYCNPALREWLGVDRHGAARPACDYHSGTARVTRPIWRPGCVRRPRSSRASGLRAEISCRDAAGHGPAPPAEFLPLPPGSPGRVPVLALVDAANLTDLAPPAVVAAEPAALHAAAAHPAQRPPTAAAAGPDRSARARRSCGCASRSGWRSRGKPGWWWSGRRAAAGSTSPGRFTTAAAR